jgi:hypothetical protein
VASRRRRYFAALSLSLSLLSRIAPSKSVKIVEPKEDSENSHASPGLHLSFFFLFS